MSNECILLTGATGFFGQHLLRHLLSCGISVPIYAIVRRPISLLGIVPVQGDLADADITSRLIQELRPQLVFHLAGAIFTTDWDVLMKAHVKSTINLMEALRSYSPGARVVVVGSAAEYGDVSPENLPISENMPCSPVTPYGASKCAETAVALTYRKDLKVIVGRVFNTIGPGLSKDSSFGSFAAQLVAIERGEQPAILRTGNLESRRDLLDIRDVVVALYLLAKRGRSGAIYNVCKGQSVRMRELLDMLLSFVPFRVAIETDVSRLSANDVLDSYGDPTKLKSEIGWQPKWSIEDSFRDILDEYRANHSAR